MQKSSSDALVVDADTDMEPTLLNIIKKSSLKWIFVGGKGGVGKTTCSSSLAIQLAKVRSSVLIISTDPAHNLSDAFGQKFSKEPGLVQGYNNLYAMNPFNDQFKEVEPSLESLEETEGAGAGGIFGTSGLLQDIALAIPGIDEAMSFAEVLKLVQNMEFSCIVFDTAPTGHTLRLLSFPSVLENALNKFMGLSGQFSGLFQQFAAMFGGGSEMGKVSEKMQETKKVIEEVNQQFKNPKLTTFVCVCIPEFLSLYETERLILELNKFEIDTQNIIINQVLYPEKDSECKLCGTRAKMQQKYIDQIYDLYDLFHIVKLPLLPYEIRSGPVLEKFSNNLIIPYCGENK